MRSQNNIHTYTCSKILIQIQPFFIERGYNGAIDFDYTIPDKKTGKSHHVRVVVLKLPCGTLEVLATSLFDRNVFSLSDLGKAYMLRWQIEECYKRLKFGAELENFSGVNLEAVLQEFWAHIVMCNILSAYMCDEQGFWEIDNLPEYRLNFSFLFGVMRDKLFQLLLDDLSIESFHNFFVRAVSRARVKVRPGRLYSRAKCNKPKRHHVFRRVC